MFTAQSRRCTATTATTIRFIGHYGDRRGHVAAATTEKSDEIIAWRAKAKRVCRV